VGSALTDPVGRYGEHLLLERVAVQLEQRVAGAHA